MTAAQAVGAVLLVAAWATPAEAADPIMDLLASRGLAPAAVEAPPSAARSLFVPEDAAQTRRSAALVYAMAYVGVPYRLGGNGFEGGVDCSGFVQVTYLESAGIRLPRRAVEQAQATEPIAEDALAPGDLVFFNTRGQPFSHVGIYVGQGRFIHSPRTGAQVRMERMDARYWRDRFDGARRVIGAASG